MNGHTDMGTPIVIATAYVMAGFGVLVTTWSIVAKLNGRSAWPVWRRYLSWFAIVPPILIPLAYSGTGFRFVMMALSMACYREYCRATGLWKDTRLVVVGYAAIAAIYYPVFVHWYGLYQAMPIYALVLVIIVPICRDSYEHMIQKVCLSVLGVLCFGWFMSHVAFLSTVDASIGSIFFLLVIVESNDAFGYLWGSLLGRHKLAPRISPNKTAEGMLGAVASVMGVAFLLRGLVPHLGTLHLMIVTFVLAVFGVCGDLMISFIKRDLNLKDTGSIIPGHGGLLDRFDSLIITAPLFFHFVRYHYGHISTGW